LPQQKLPLCVKASCGINKKAASFLYKLFWPKHKAAFAAKSKLSSPQQKQPLRLEDSCCGDNKGCD
jgi:hypothetical protein